MGSRITEAHRACLQDHYRREIEPMEAEQMHGRSRHGWARWEAGDPARTRRPWNVDDINELESWGLIKVAVEWQDNWVRVTAAGRRILFSEGA